MRRTSEADRSSEFQRSVSESITIRPYGADFAGVPMADAAGAPMVASIDVSGCGSTAVLVSPRLIEAVPAPVVESALANPAAVSGYGMLRDPGKPASPYNSYRTCLSLQNLSVPWHPLHNALVFKAACH